MHHGGLTSGLCSHYDIGGSGGMLPQENFSFLCVSKLILVHLLHVHDSTAKNIHLQLFKIMAKFRGALPPYVLNWGGKCPPSPPGSYASAVITDFPLIWYNGGSISFDVVLKGSQWFS